MSNVTKQCRDREELSAQAKKACALFMEECKRQGLNVLITETYRSQERQNYLYEQGRTRPGQVVTWTRKSNHTGRNAWDICKNVKGQEYSDSSFFKKAGTIAKELGITWGGVWSTPDTPHFEIDKDWKAPKEEEKVEKQKINLNGVVREVDVIKKGDNNFIKLQDLRDDKIVVGYDEKNKIPVVKVVG